MSPINTRTPVMGHPSLLIDRQIRAALDAGDIVVDPDGGVDSRIQPASLDVRLGDKFLVFDRHRVGMIDPRADHTDDWNLHEIAGEPEGQAFIVQPGELVLGSTLEALQLSDTLLARVEGKSSLGRLGLLVHATAGYVDPGWQLAQITLEISVQIGVPVKIYPGMPIAQLAFEQVEQVGASYSGKYVGQDGPTPSKFHKNWTGSRWI